MTLDTQPPAWLERNWSPKPSFDPTPWLQDRYARQIDAQVIPLKIQGMQLQNQAEQLHIEQQGMMNEQAGMELNDYKTQLPIFQEAMKSTGGNIKTLMDSPLPSGVTNPKLVQMWLNAQHAAANTTLGQSYMQDQIELTKSANALVQAGGDPMPAYIEGPNGPEGPHRIDREALAKQWQAVGADKEAAALRRIKAQTSWHFDANGNPIAGTRGAGHMFATEASDKLLWDLENERDTALDEGNYAYAQQVQGHIDHLNASHPNILQKTKLQALRAERVMIAKEMIASKPGSKAYLELEEKYNKKTAEMDKEANTMPATPDASGGSKSYKWTPGGIVPK